MTAFSQDTKSLASLSQRQDAWKFIVLMLLLRESEDEITAPVNLGNPTEFTILELAEKVCEIVGIEANLEFKDLLTDDPVQRQPDISLARAKLNRKPEVQFQQGLAREVGPLLQGFII